MIIVPIVIVIILLALFLYILQNPVRGIYLVTFFLPFEYIGSYDWQGITIRLSQLLAVMTIIAWILDGLGKRSLKFVRNPMFVFASLFLLVNIISLANAPNLLHSILVLSFVVFTIVFGFTIPNLVLQKEQLIKIIKILFISTFLVSLFGLFQFVGDMLGLSQSFTGLRFQYTREILGFTRIQSTFLEPLYFANFLIIPICLSLALLISKKEYFKIGMLQTFPSPSRIFFFDKHSCINTYKIFAYALKLNDIVLGNVFLL